MIACVLSNQKLNLGWHPIWAAAAPKCCQSGSTSSWPNCMATDRSAASGMTAVAREGM